MKKLSLKHLEVISIRLSRNFGQHPAIIASLNQAKGEWIMVMDCDLQGQPKEIVKLYNKTKEGFEVVFARRENRKDGFFKKTSSKLFYFMYNYLTDTQIDSTIANFGIYNNKVITQVVKMNYYIKSFPLFVKRVGYKSTSIEIEHARRKSGKSSNTFFKFLSLAFNTIISFSNKPLKIFVKLGLAMSLLFFLVGRYNIYSLYKSNRVLDYSSIFVSIWFLSGIIITTIGVREIYIGKIFDQTKKRELYII